MTPQTLVELLTWLAAGSSAAVSAMLVSWAAENWDWFQGLTSNQKFMLQVVTSVTLGLSSWAILTYVPAETLQALEAPFKVFMLAILPLIASKWWHESVNKSKPNVTILGGEQNIDTENVNVESVTLETNATNEGVSETDKSGGLG